MKSLSVNIQMKAIEQYFPVVLFLMQSTETTAYKAYRTRIEWYCCYVFSIYDRRKFQEIY